MYESASDIDGMLKNTQPIITIIIVYRLLIKLGKRLSVSARRYYPGPRIRPFLLPDADLADHAALQVHLTGQAGDHQHAVEVADHAGWGNLVDGEQVWQHRAISQAVLRM